MNCDNCSSCDPCNKCGQACYKPYFNLSPDPLDGSYWLWEMGCENGRIKVPPIGETCTSLSLNYTSATLNYKGECETQSITGKQLGSIISLKDLRDVVAENPDACSMLVFNPGCDQCPCAPDQMTWQAYNIPDAGECIIPLDDDGYYRVLVKGDCGCIKECRLPASASDSTTLNYVRDSVPDDPDFPWYYGQYNDTINLYLAQNASRFFGLYPLEVTVYYGIQVVHPTIAPNVNFRSLLVPVVAGTSINVSQMSSILQDDSTVNTGTPQIPWGTKSMRGSFTFIVPKGKEAYLHHEFRLRTMASFPNYATNALDGQIVPEEIAGQVDRMAYIGSRLNALQVVIKPTGGASNFSPAVDTVRTQLDPAVDEYPAIN